MTQKSEPGASRDVVVVLSYHGREDTLSCVDSLVTGSPEAVVLVVDNGSRDGTLEAVQDRWPRMDTLQTGTNLGFSGGMNAGLRWALDQDARTVTVLNNDTTVPAGAVAALAVRACAGPVLVSPEVHYANTPDEVWFGGGLIDQVTSLPRHADATELEATSLDAEGLRASEILAGCCLTGSAATWRAVGLFDDRFFLTFEDSELSLRATRLGVPLLVDTTVVIHHKVSASFVGAYTYLGLFYYVRNGLLFGALQRPHRLAARLRFLRRHVAGEVMGPLRRRELVEALRRILIVAWAIGCRALRRYGPAPTPIGRLAQRWATKESPVTVSASPR